jgi:hypothetical protein
MISVAKITISNIQRDDPMKNFVNVSFTVSPSDSLFKIIAYKLIGNQQPKKKIKISKYITCLFNAFASLRLHDKDKNKINK